MNLALFWLIPSIPSMPNPQKPWRLFPWGMAAMTTEVLEVLHQKPFRWPSRPVLSVSTKTRRFPQEYHTSRFHGLSWSIIIFPPCFLQHCKNWWVSLSYIGFHLVSICFNIFPYLLNDFFPGFYGVPHTTVGFVLIFSPSFHGFPRSFPRLWQPVTGLRDPFEELHSIISVSDDI